MAKSPTYRQNENLGDEVQQKSRYFIIFESGNNWVRRFMSQLLSLVARTHGYYAGVFVL